MDLSLTKRGGVAGSKNVFPVSVDPPRAMRHTLGFGAHYVF
jgi:hypothetical protein